MKRLLVRRLRDAGPLRRRPTAVACNAVAMFAMAVTLFVLKPDDRVLAAPMLAIAEIVLLFVSVLWTRDGVPSVFEAGTLCVLATAVYGILPLLGFLLMHGEWYRNADGRLFAYAFVPSELGMFGWRYVVYTGSFALTYLLIRGDAAVRGTDFEMPPATTVTSIVIVFAVLYLCKIVLRVVYGYEIDVSYAEGYKLAAAIGRMPYVVLQIGQNVVAALLVAQQGVMILLLARWRTWWCRAALVTWLGFELVTRSLMMGARTSLVLLLLSVGILYHRLVKPLSFRLLALGGTILIAGFLILGTIRSMQSAAPTEPPDNPLLASNEFQALFVTAFDLYKMKEAGALHVPWQVYASEAYMFIPSQFLPFEKIDPAGWYIDVIGQSGLGVGFMFGVMSQAAVGLGWIELVLRGVALAACLALLHRWYVRRAVRFWPTLFYVFISIWIYYTFRATTFWNIYFIVYRFLPVFVAAKVLEALLSRSRRAAPGVKAVPA
jgi:hypothetical protein